MLERPKKRSNGSRWKAVDKQSASELQAFLQQTPQGPFIVDGRQRLAALLEAQRVRAESDYWNALDKPRETAS